MQMGTNELELEGSDGQNLANLVGLASNACAVLKIVSSASFGNPVFVRCYSSCVSFLTYVVELVASKAKIKSSIAKLLQILKDHNVVQIVIKNAKKTAKPDLNSPPNQLFLSISLLNGLVKCGTQSALLLLNSCDASQILWIEGSGDIMQQEICSSETKHGDGFSSLEQHLHVKLSFLTEWLESINSAIESSGGLGELAYSLAGHALNFVRTYRFQLLQSLTNVCGKRITWEVLNDACAFLNILVELCRNNALAKLTQQSPEMSAGIHDALLSVVSTLGVFLGASSAARDIFRRTDHVGEQDVDGVYHLSSFGSHLSNQSFPKGGLQNIRHEAVRYSHFVSRISARVFPKSFSKDFSGETTPDSNSMTALENACRSIVCQDFEALESKVRVSLQS
jgi:hypothetical protein